MIWRKGWTLICLAVFGASEVLAQPEMATGMRAEGKIYVVVAVVAVVMAAVLTYLIWIDRKITRVEKQLKNKQ